MAELKYQLPRGTQDIYGDEMSLWQQAENLIRQQCRLYGYSEIRTPVFEHTEVFKGENDSSDMVNKEMYSFKDNGQRDLTLRPEGTKGIIRSFVEHKMYGNSDLPVKLFYLEPMFRYDRPQKGRYRQFHQFGIEAIGLRNPSLDVECIALGYRITKLMGINNVVVLVNSLGDKESRDNYRTALKDYFAPYLDCLCDDCKRRYKQNPLRILDCKVDKDKDFFASAPKCRDYLTADSKKYFQAVLQGLDELNIPYRIDDRLVRGLDYYTNTVFEAVPIDDDGQQATLFGGGQYDGLISSFNGPDYAGVGFGMGMERLINLSVEQQGIQPIKKQSDVYVISLGEVSDYSLKIAEMLRSNNIVTALDFTGRSLKAQFKSSDRLDSKVIVIVGEEEKNSQTAQIKDTVKKEQYTVDFAEIINKVKEILGE
ncbi:MAG: histidine--tRNA ligase [Erysipelotrichaceae bacterium]